MYLEYMSSKHKKRKVIDWHKMEGMDILFPNHLISLNI